MRFQKILVVCLVCSVAVITTACNARHVAVVNTNSGLYAKKEFSEKSKAQMNGRLLKLGGEKCDDFGPSFEFHHLRR